MFTRRENWKLKKIRKKERAARDREKKKKEREKERKKKRQRQKERKRKEEVQRWVWSNLEEFNKVDSLHFV